MNESITIQVKLASGWEQEFSTLTEMFQWLAHFELEPCENGWNELNEYCERRVAYAASDEPGAPSCELLVQHHQPGVAHAYIEAEEDGEEFKTFSGKRDFIQWVQESLGENGTRELAEKIYQYLWNTAEHIGLPQWNHNWARFLKDFDGWNLLQKIEENENAE